MNKYAALYFIRQSSRQYQTLFSNFRQHFQGEAFSKNEFKEFSKLQGIEVHFAKLQNIQDDVERGIQQGLHFIACDSELFPQELKMMEDPPLVVCVQGALSSFWNNRIGIVGSREPRPETNSFIEVIMAEFLAKTKAVVVSGGARGVDQKVHLSALQRGLPTIAVIPSGLLKVYPSGFSQWQNEILRLGGMLISEYLPSQEMKKAHFEARNRIISGLGQLIFVVEARKKSGSLITAKCAIAQGKTVAVVPGHPTDFHFTGCLDLLADGAFPIRCAEDLIMLYRAESHFLELPHH